MKETIIIVEPGFQSSKAYLVEQLKQNTDYHFIYAQGLAFMDYSWLEEKYSIKGFVFDYQSHHDLTQQTKQYASKYQLKICGALCWVETSVGFCNQLQMDLQLPSISQDPQASYRHKGLVREKIQSSFSHYNPNFYYFSDASPTYDELKEKNLAFPFIIKPAQMMASLGVQIINNEKELFGAIQELRTIDFHEENLRKIYGNITQDIVVEEIIYGNEYSVESMVLNGKTHVIGITDKKTHCTNELSDTFPTNIQNEKILEAIQNFAQACHTTLKIQNSWTHIEFKLVNEMPVLIEVNARIAGDYMPELINRTLINENIGELLIHTALGKPLKDGDIELNGRWTGEFLTNPYEGRVFDLDLEKAQQNQLTLLVGNKEVLWTNESNEQPRIAQRISSFNQKLDDFSFSVQKYISKTTTRTKDQIAVFQALESDVDILSNIEDGSWLKKQAASKETIRERLKIKPDNFLIAYSRNKGKPVGFIYSVPCNQSQAMKKHKWHHYACIDYAKKTLSNFDSRYIVSISVLPDAPIGTAVEIIRAAKIFYKEEAIKSIFYGIRIPNFAYWHELGISIDQYHSGLKISKYNEYGYRAATSSGATDLGLLKDYYDDPESMNFGIMFENKL
jgi:biotin carboxylase